MQIANRQDLSAKKIRQIVIVDFKCQHVGTCLTDHPNLQQVCQKGMMASYESQQNGQFQPGELRCGSPLCHATQG
jgi:hypothetical protein